MADGRDSPAPAPALADIAVWDWPTRLGHWLIVVLVGAAWWTEAHDDMAWHLRFGYALMAVVLFRLGWGVVGSSTARFSGFVRGPAVVWRYATKLMGGRTGDFVIGHNPMGGWSVLALLAMLAAEIGFGLFAVDVDGIESGPLAARVSFHAGRTAAHWHHQLFNVLLGLIALHLAAIAFYAVVRGEDLVGPMLSGRREAPVGAAPVRPGRTWGLIAAAVAAVLVAVAFAAGWVQ